MRTEEEIREECRAMHEMRAKHKNTDYDDAILWLEWVLNDKECE